MNNTANSTSSCCGSTPAAAPVPSEGRDNLLGNGSDDMTTCPVMVGTPVSKQAAEAAGLFRDHEGQRYWFCCAGCGPAFDSNPAHYAANMA